MNLLKVFVADSFKVCKSLGMHYLVDPALLKQHFFIKINIEIF